MRKVDKLVFSAILPPLLISFLVLTFVGVNYNLGKLSELLITGNASPEVVGMIAATLVPPIMIFSLPLSFLIGSLIGLSGLAGESQITALRACGIPLRRLLKPILLTAVPVAIATGILSLFVLPKTNDIYDAIRGLVSLRQATSMVKPRVFNEDFANVVFYLDDLSLDRQMWHGVFLADSSVPGSQRIVLAREGSWVSDHAGARLQLHLEKGTVYEVNPQDPSKDNVSVFGATDIPIDLVRGGAADTAAAPRKPSQLSTFALVAGPSGADPLRRREELIELHKRLALPCAVFGFAFVALALGANSRRGGRTFGSVLSMILVIAYWVSFINGLRLASVGTVPPWIGAWGAGIILAAAGIVLLVFVERNSLLACLESKCHWKTHVEQVVRAFHLGSLRKAIQKVDDLVLSSSNRMARFRFPKVVDSYVSRGFFLYFFWSTLVCYSLFTLLTLFDLLDEIIRNRIPVITVLRYFTYLTPQILLYVVPMAILLAVLIQFGILEKGSEVTAMKAGGWSLYRIAVPVLLVCSFLCANIYFLQDYVLPYANKQQDALRNLIKGKPPQTSARPRKWIFGKPDTVDRIFKYDYFDPNKDIFIDLNVFELDSRHQTIERRYYAKQAAITKEGGWILENGWVRDFHGDPDAFEPFPEKRVSFPERADYFKKEIFEPRESSKLTYLELRDYINFLKQAGYNATELQVELNKKISFPVSCLVMALLGIPFSFSMGRKGAFFGITASVAIAISYWGVFSIFEQLGAYGMLSPLLAAWAPNFLFGSAGLTLFLTIRT